MIDYSNRKHPHNEPSNHQAVKTKAPLELYEDFYLEMTGQELEPSELELIKQLLTDAFREGEQS